MNKETINKYKDVFDHWLNGGEIEKRCLTSHNGWYASYAPMWEDKFEYRIKPREPRVFWVGEYNSFGGKYLSIYGDESRLAVTDLLRKFKVIEVIE